MTRINTLVVPAKAGTHSPAAHRLRKLFGDFPSSQTTGIMGPGLRRDDNVRYYPAGVIVPSTSPNPTR